MTVAAPIRPGTGRGSDYAALSRRVGQAGLLERRPAWYAARIICTVGAYVAGWAVFVLAGDSWWQLLTAAGLAVAATQVAFLGHDAGHRQMFRTRRASETAGLLLGNLATGLGYGWWMDKHTRHHANPNHIDDDPDVGAGALVWTPEQAAATQGAARWLARWQAYLFFPMLLLEGLSLRVSSVRAVLSGPVRRRVLEGSLLAVHTAAYLGLVFATLPPGRAVAFIAVHQGLWGLYMGCAFAPNHKGMPTFSAADNLDFLRKQVLTSRNVRGGWFTDLLLGGLNYQIEHHLFPSMPRPHLRHARPIVRAHCREHGLPYTEAGLLDSYAEALRHLHAVGRPLR
ncbi:fatty acid desaturase family protein [Solwaraspora sp. WMMB335]|uniref:fatty acid desaturase family protein n=1 Tax=Solwaraspora sp. WMMB335 TaxID=3404118 RepID=UPI003B964229